MSPVVGKPGGSLRPSLLVLWILLRLLSLLGRRWLLPLDWRG